MSSGLAHSQAGSLDQGSSGRVLFVFFNPAGACRLVLCARLELVRAAVKIVRPTVEQATSHLGQTLRKVGPSLIRNFALLPCPLVVFPSSSSRVRPPGPCGFRPGFGWSGLDRLLHAGASRRRLRVGVSGQAPS